MRTIVATLALVSLLPVPHVAAAHRAAAEGSETPAAQDSSRPLLVIVPDLPPARTGSVRAFFADGRVDSAFLNSIAVPSWSPDGRRVAFLRNDSTGRAVLIVRHLQGKEDTLSGDRLDVRPLYAWPVWSPRGDELGILSGDAGQFSSSAQFVVIDLINLRVRRRYQIPGAVMHPFGDIESGDKARWSPDGSALLVSDQKAFILDLVGGGTEVISTKRIVAEWMPDGRGVYYLDINLQSAPRARPSATFNMRLRGSAAPTRLADSGALAQAGIRLLPALVPGSFELSPSGRKLALTAGVDSAAFAIHVYDLEAGKEVDITKPSITLRPTTFPLRIEWSADEKQIAALVLGKPGEISVDRVDLQTGTTARLATIPMHPAAFEFIFLMKFMSWTR